MMCLDLSAPMEVAAPAVAPTHSSRRVASDDTEWRRRHRRLKSSSLCTPLTGAEHGADSSLHTFESVSEHTTDSDVPRRSRGDGGMTLVEILVTIVITGTLVAAVVSATFTVVAVSGRSFTAAEVETVLINASDRITRAPQLCDYEAYVDAAALAEKWDPSLISVVVERLVSNTGNLSSDWEPQTCPADVAPFDVQRLTITVTDPGGRITRDLTVVKSSVS